MKRTGRKKEWSITLFLIGIIAFFPPIVSLFDGPMLVGGFPLSYLFLFVAWGAIILAVALSSKKRVIPDPTAVYDEYSRDESMVPKKRGDDT